MEIFLTRKEAAEYLKISKHTLDSWASKKSKKLPFLKEGNFIRYKKSDLDNFLANLKYAE